MAIPPIGPVATPALPGSLPDPGAAAPGGASAVGPGGLPGLDQAAFERAAAPVQEVQAAPAADATTLGGHVASGVEALSQRLAGWQKAHAAAASLPAAAPGPSGGVPSLTRAMEDAVAGMQGAYVFAIEATLASHGSTEMSKVFNTLLKGQ